MDGGDRLELSKRVKIEPEDEDNLVIDENVGFGEDLSINSEESNENEEVPLIGIVHQETNANSVGGKRSSSDSSTETSSTSKNLKITLVKKNGHDANISRVPKLTSKESSSKVFEECNSTSNNSVDSNSSVNEKVLRLEREIQGLASLLKTKEQEWNAILRLKKLKELEVEFLRRQKEVEEVFEDETIQQHEEYLRKLGDKINVEGGKIGPDEADVRSNTEKTDKEGKELEKKLKNSRVNAGNGKKENSKDLKTTDGHLENFKASLALQQLCERNRNSLAQANSPVQLTSNANIQNKVIGEGRQGTIVEVRSIIADYRSKNPEETGSNQEARRRAQKKGASSQPRTSVNTVGTSIISQNQNVSFKDVLVNLAKLSQNEKTGVLTTLENVTATPRAVSKTNNVQNNSFSSQRGQLGTTLAKLLSSNSSSSTLPVGIVHPEDGNSVGSLKIEAVNHTSDSNLSLANLLASAKCRDDEIKTEDDDLVPICQGCNTNRAQFVCAGCGNQWYCCRECQIQAWEDHSEVCSG
ncbi:unnamed protein product [Allacma fusca]|uniref:MYND-type domain-containing protein n=1 Tax=Allacma fusca TaxID=39272 RepID=A0A8J2LS34_9HEXA|nr:unnamed protein product [Allacma fusca]